MTTQLETAIRQSDLLNRLVLNYETTEEVGRVQELWLDAKAHQVVGLTCKSGFLGRNKHSFAWTQIETIGTDSILVKAQEETEPEPPSVESVVGLEVWTDAGNKAGSLTDYRFDSKTGMVIDYLFVSNGWRGVTEGVYQLPASAIVSMGSKRAIAQDTAVQNAEQYTEGLSQKIAQAAEFIKEDYAQTQQDLATAMQGTQQVTSQTKEKLSEVASQAQDKFSELKTQFQSGDRPAVDPERELTQSETNSNSESKDSSHST